jgi:hypothetical protein
MLARISCRLAGFGSVWYALVIAGDDSKSGGDYSIVTGTRTGQQDEVKVCIAALTCNLEPATCNYFGGSYGFI